LKESKLFSGLLATQLQALEQTAQLKTYKAGDRIFEEGQPGDGLYIIVKGRVAISTLIAQSRPDPPRPSRRKTPKSISSHNTICWRCLAAGPA
jgi:hypothetical protein